MITKSRSHAARAVIMATATVAALAIIPTGPALAQGGSWSSRVESPPPLPPGTVVLPKAAVKPRLLDMPAHQQSDRRAPAYTGRLEPRGSSVLKSSGPDLTAAKAPPAPSGGDPAYQAFDNAQFLTALKLAEQAAAKGQPESHTLIARIHSEGHGVPRDLGLAARWYYRAAELGDPEAAFALGLMYAEGRGVEKNFPNAAALFERAAATGHFYANYNLGMMFLSGRGKPENPIRGAQHIAYAAEKGIAAAQYDLATLYINGHGVPADGFLASRWLKRAAEFGMAEAQFDYAIMLLKGQGLNADRPDALRYLTAAAEQGLSAAQNRLAHGLLEGFGGTKNPREAAKWRLIAKSQGLSDDKLDAQLARLPGADRAAAEVLASQWRERAHIGAGRP